MVLAEAAEYVLAHANKKEVGDDQGV
jgi:hypothetical protein